MRTQLVARLALACLACVAWAPASADVAAAPARQDVDQWINRLKDADALKRSDAANELGKLGSKAKAAVPALVTALKDSDSLVRSAAAFALGFIREDAARVVPALNTALSDENEYVRSAAASALAMFGADAAAAAGALSMIGPDAQPAAARLIELISDSDKHVRAAAALAVGNVKARSADAVPALVKALKDEYVQVRKAAVLSLGRLPTTAGRDALQQLANDDPDESVRKLARETLARMPKVVQQEPDPEPKTKGDPGKTPPAALTFKEYRDPKEGAFVAQVPAGWKATGGTTRPYLNFTTFEVQATSPDGQIVILLRKNDATRVVPTPELAKVGFKEGDFLPITGSGKVPIRKYTPGAEFAKVWVLPQRSHEGFKELHVKSWPDVAKALVRLEGFEDVDVGEIRYAFERGGKAYRGGAFVVTRQFGAPGAAPSLWHCDTLALYEAPEGREQEARAALVRLLASWRIDLQWQAGMSAALKRSVAIMNEANAYTSQLITSTFWQRRATEDRIFARDSEVRLGTLQVMDPRTGEVYTVDNTHTYYFITHDGKRYGSEDAAARDPLRDSPLVILGGK